MMRKQKIRLGWAGVDVTPSKKTMLYGQFYTRISGGVHDPVTATALALESADGRQRGIMISVDAIGISDFVRGLFDRLIRRRLPDVPPECIMINATHTHTAPTQPFVFVTQKVSRRDVVTPEAYGRFLAQQLAKVAVQAWKKREFGDVSWGCGQAVVGYNRRASYFDGTSIMYGKVDDPTFSHIEGHEDHGVNFLFTYDPAGSLTGMIVNLACPSQCTEHAMVVSADFWHDVREELRNQWGAGLYVMPQCSAAGDQSPHWMLNRRAEERMLALQGLMADSSRNSACWAQRKVIARRVADAAAEVLPAVAQDVRDKVEFQSLCAQVSTLRRRMTPADVRACQERIGFFKSQAAEFKKRGIDPFAPDYSSCLGQLFRNQYALDIHEAQTRGQELTLPVVVYAFRIGDVVFVSNRFEYMVDYGQRIKARSPALQTFVVQLAGAGTYLATARAEQAGGYGAWFSSTWVGAPGGQLIVETSLKLIQRLFA